MPTLRIQFPEKEAPTTLALSGSRITVGRRADNTVQIVDRMISAFHAELIQEDDHYRLHDLGSTNGTHVNGERVTDFHLREACKISFGPVECEFSPEAAANRPAEALPTRVEVESVRRESEDLRGRLDIAQKELEAMRTARAAGDDEGGSNLLREELERAIRERAEMQQTIQKREQEFAALRSELARMNRDRQNLQDVLSQANAELARLREGGTPETKAPQMPVPASEPGSAATPKEELPTGTISGLPRPTSLPAAVPPAPSAPGERPAMPAASPASTPKPFVRPAPTAVPATSGAPRPIARAVAASPRPSAGPSGTQRISVPTPGATGETSTAPAQPRAIPKMAPKPLPRPTALSGPKPPTPAAQPEQSPTE